MLFFSHFNFHRTLFLSFLLFSAFGASLFLQATAPRLSLNQFFWLVTVAFVTSHPLSKRISVYGRSRRHNAKTKYDITCRRLGLLIVCPARRSFNLRSFNSPLELAKRSVQSFPRHTARTLTTRYLLFESPTLALAALAFFSEHYFRLSDISYCRTFRLRSVNDLRWEQSR